MTLAEWQRRLMDTVFRWAHPVSSNGHPQSKAMILLVDDERQLTQMVAYRLLANGYEVMAAASGEEALPQAEKYRPQVLLIDYKLPQMSGLDVLREAKQKNPAVVAIMITGLTHQTAQIEEESALLGADGFLHKPLHMETVLQIVNDHVKRGG